MVAVLTDSLQVCHSPEGMRHTLNTPYRAASISPIHVGLWGRIFCRSFGKSDNDAIRCRHNLSSSWMAVVMLTCVPVATLSA